MLLNPALRPLYPLIGSAASGAGVITILAAPARRLPFSCADAETHRRQSEQMRMRNVRIMFLLLALETKSLMRVLLDRFHVQSDAQPGRVRHRQQSIAA